MKTIEVQIPDPVYDRARQFSERENIPIGQVVALALAQALGARRSPSYIALRAAHADRG